MRATKEQADRNNRFMTYLLKNQGFRYFNELGKVLGVKPPHMSDIRSGRLNISADVLINIHENLDIPFSKIREYVPKE